MEKIVVVVTYKNKHTGKTGEDTLIMNYSDGISRDSDKFNDKLNVAVKAIGRLKGFTDTLVYSVIFCDEREISERLKEIRADIDCYLENCDYFGCEPLFSFSR